MIKKLLFFVSLFFLFSLDTYAVEYTPYWGYDLTHFTTGQFYNCTNSTSCNETVNTTPQWGQENSEIDTRQFPGFFSDAIVTVPDSYGAMFTFNIEETLTLDYYYSVQFYMCNSSNNATLEFVDLFGATSFTALTNYTYPLQLKHTVNYVNLNNQPYPYVNRDGLVLNGTQYNCRAMTAVFKPTYKTTILGFQYTTTSTVTSNWYAVGYKIENLGFSNYLTSSQVEDMLDNAGFATADSVEEVDQSINEVKQEIAGMEDQQIQTNEKLDDLNDNITNNNVSGVEESFSQFEDFLDDNSTITQLITLPVTLYSSILQGISSSCTPFNLGNLYGESLILPCVNIGNYLGATLWGMIDLIISGFAIYSISKKLIKVFNNFSSMKDGDVIDD